MSSHENIVGAQVVFPCQDVNETVSFFTERLQFEVQSIYPADDPQVANIIGYGLTLRLQRDNREIQYPQGELVLSCHQVPECTELISPNGIKITFHLHEKPVTVPTLKPARVYTALSGRDLNGNTTTNNTSPWVKGRAGMMYRDLIPCRLGGRFVASHIRIPTGGKVPDYNHFHRVRFQMIYCFKGWVKVVYEDQGEPFILEAGDCVIQPPTIRHRVLESSDELEVVEIGCPADHETIADRQIVLPSDSINKGRLFEGQKFVRHVASSAHWKPWHLKGFETRAMGFEDATDGLAEARVVRQIASSLEPSTITSHNAEFQFWFVLKGGATINFANTNDHIELMRCDSLTIPAEDKFQITASHEFEILEVSLPASLTFTSTMSS